MKKIRYFLSDKCNLGAVSINEGPFCEHCAELDPFEPTISDGSTFWCMNCWETNIGDDSWDIEIVDIPDKMKEEIKQKVKDCRREYYQRKLKENEDC